MEIARALASNPKVLILDEPVAGLTRDQGLAVMEKLRALKDHGLGILLIEHHMEAVMSVSDIITVLNFGIKIAEGTPEQIKRNDKVIAAYLGRSEKSV